MRTKLLGATIASFEQSAKPQVFPRLATIFIKNGRRSGVLQAIASHGDAPEASANEQLKVKLRWVLLALLMPSRQNQRLYDAQAAISAGASSNDMILLIFTSALPRRFRFAPTVTILQQPAHLIS